MRIHTIHTMRMRQERNGVSVGCVQSGAVKRRRNIVWDATTDRLAVDLAHQRCVAVSRLLEELVVEAAGVPAERVRAPGALPAQVLRDYMDAEIDRRIAERVMQARRKGSGRYMGPRRRKQG